MTDTMRITTNNGRHTKGRAYSPKHNDRQFSLQNSPHIDPARTSNNWEWQWLENDGVLCSFEDAEREYYARYISDHLQAVNRRYEAQRHPERAKTIDEYRRAPQSCPEETIVCIGNRDNHPDPGELLAAYLELQHWQQQQFPQLHVLDYAMHLDEQGAPHVHERHVWTYTDAEGHMAIGQARALEQMGIQRPHPEQPRNRYNNAKVTYTQAVREKFVAICRQRGLEIETQPRERSQSGLTQIEYQSRQEERKLQALRQQCQSVQAQCEKLQQQYQKTQTQTQELQLQTEELQQQRQEMQTQTQKLQLQNQTLQMQYQSEYRRLQQATARRQAVSRQVQAATHDLQELQKYMTEAQQRRTTTIEQVNRDREQRPLGRSRSYDYYDYDDLER